jgi:hypothetical protein
LLLLVLLLVLLHALLLLSSAGCFKPLSCKQHTNSPGLGSWYAATYSAPAHHISCYLLLLIAAAQVLLENIAAQGETLHFVALAALQQPDVSQDSEEDQECTMASMARCLMEDVKVRLS